MDCIHALQQLENFLAQNDNAPCTSGKHLRTIEDFCARKIGELTYVRTAGARIYRHVLVKDDNGRDIALLSYAAAQPLPVVVRAHEHHAHPGHYKQATLRACTHLAKRFDLSLDLVLVSYEFVTGKGYRVRERRYQVTPNHTIASSQKRIRYLSTTRNAS